MCCCNRERTSDKAISGLLQSIAENGSVSVFRMNGEKRVERLQDSVFLYDDGTVSHLESRGIRESSLHSNSPSCNWRPLSFPHRVNLIIKILGCLARTTLCRKVMGPRGWKSPMQECNILARWWKTAVDQSVNLDIGDWKIVVSKETYGLRDTDQNIFSTR